MPTLPRQWREPAPLSPPDDLIAACDGDALIARLLLQRGVTSGAGARAFLDPDQYSPTPPSDFPDLPEAVGLLRAALDAGQRLLIWGDFDVDGQTATALLLDGLRRLGADVQSYVPDRLTEGHGIKLPALQRELSRVTPALLLTCDTGVTEFESIAYARNDGLTVIITDHHELGAILPNAHAVINPRRLPDDHPAATLPGVGVAYKLMEHLFTLRGREGELPALLDLVALGIVGDVATQTGDTRYLLQRGLAQLRDTGRVGLQALMEAARVSSAVVSAEQVGFQLAPRLNAAGRLGNAADSVELLITTDRARAAFIAQQLEGLNGERRLQTRQIELAAEEMIAEDKTLIDEAVLVLYHPAWHSGLVGIVANSLAERYGRPVILFGGEAAGVAKGSARAPSGFDIYSAILAHAPLLRSYGGHPGAAGLAIDVGKIDQFRKLVSRALRTTQALPEVPELSLDLVVSLDQVTPDLVRRLARLSPFGEGNPRLVVATHDVTLTHATKIGRADQHRKLRVQDAAGHELTLLWWESGREPLPEGHFDVAYHVTLTAQGELEVTLVAWRLREAITPASTIPQRTVYDWRHERDPLAALARIEAADAVIWAEAYPRRQQPTWKRRAELAAAPALIVLTAPPDADTFAAALDAVQPTTVYLIATDPPLTKADDLLAQVGIAARNVLEQHKGVIDLSILCGATALSGAAVMAGLAVLTAEGQIGSVSLGRTLVRISPVEQGQEVPAEQKGALRVRFEAAVKEVAAYRRFFRESPLEVLGL